MKRNLYLVFISVLTMMACQSNPSAQTRHFHWVGQENEEIIMTQHGNVFRGEYIDPGFQDYCSVPIVGMIDNEGNVHGAGFDIQDGSLYAQISGKITGDTFEANWSPLPQAISEFRSMNMKRQKPAPEIEREIAKHPDAFYNWLFPEKQLCTSSSEALNRVTPFLSEKPVVAGTSSSEALNRVTPFLPEKTVVDDGQLYGYQIGEWEMKRLHIVPAEKADEVNFYIAIEQNGQYWINVEMEGAAKLTGNTFRYREKGYEFEVVVYNGFATITTIAGTIELSSQEVDDLFELRADGAYPLLPKGLVDKQFYEINFYQ